MLEISAIRYCMYNTYMEYQINDDNDLILQHWYYCDKLYT